MRRDQLTGTRRNRARLTRLAGWALAAAIAAAGAAEWLFVDHSPRLLYLLYLALIMLVGAVAASTLVWMLHAWRTPDSLDAGRLAADGRAPACSFSLIVPARHEEAVLGTTLDRLVASEHPDFEVLVVVGHDDPGTRQAAERAAARHPGLVKVIVDASWPKSKPKALNAALPHCSAAITGVFDAEDDVHPGLLRRVDQCFQATDADIVQAGVQLMNFRSRWFSVHNVLEYYFWFRSRLHLHARQRFIPLGGNTVFIRTPILRAVGGWLDCLTEDCEIGVRLSALGARTAVFYEPELVTREECPATVGAFVRQRTRWNQGYLQTLAQGYWRRLPLAQRALGAYILMSPYVMALAWVLIPAAIATAVAIKAPIVTALLSFLPLLPMVGMLVAQGAGLAEFCRAYGERPKVLDYCRLIFGLVPYQFLLAYAAARAVGRQASGRQGWDKTPHLGLHLGQPAIAAAVPQAASPQGTVPQEAFPQEAAGLVQAESQRSHHYAAAGFAADAARTGSGVAELPAMDLDHLFGDVGGDPLWARLDGGPALAAAPPPPGSTAVSTPGSTPGSTAGGAAGPAGRRAARLRAVLSRSGGPLIVICLVAVAGVVTGTNLANWPHTQFDEGTYVSYAWALQHGRLANYTYSYGHPPLSWILIFAWTELTSAGGRAVFSIVHAREFMLAVLLASCALLYVLARRLDFARPTAVAAVALFALCPLSVYWHRAALLNNPAMAFTIASLVLARTPRRRIWAFAGSGACFAIAVLCKETAVLLLPAVLYAAAQHADRRTRSYCLALLTAAIALIAGFYPLYATLKGELLPGPGHVSLIGYIIVQLVTRKTTGSILNPASQAHAIVESWLQLDQWLLYAALALTLVAFARRTMRPVALAFAILVVMMFRPGYLPNMYVINMLPFAALIVPGSVEAVWRWAGRTRHGFLTAASRAVLAAAAAAAVAFIAPRWAATDHQAMTVRQNGPELAAEQWIVGHIPRDNRLIVGDQYWIYLIEHGFNDQPMKGGFFSDKVVSYWPLDYDPAVKKAFPRGWREFNYVVVNQAMLDTLNQTPTAAAAIAHSRLVASFGHGLGNVQVRQIVPAGN